MKINKIITLVIISLFLMIRLNAQTIDRVVTIYFGGTSCVVEGYLPEKTAWGNHQELLATLHSNQLHSATQFKYHIDGIGSRNHCGSAEALVQLAEPWINGCWGWDAVRERAKNILAPILTDPTINNVIINLVGYSRGGVSALALADLLGSPKDIGDLNNPKDDKERKDVLFPNYEYKIKKLNILVFDPVAGDRTDWKQRWRDFSLPKNVSNFVGIYAADERSWLFAPIQPAFHGAVVTPKHTNSWSVLVRGTHETLVGNKQADGHSIVLGVPSMDVNETDEALESIYKISEIIAIELLGTLEWGGVQFDLPDEEVCKYVWSWIVERKNLSSYEKKKKFIGYINEMDIYPEKNSTNPANYHSWETMRLTNIAAANEWCGEYRCILEYPEMAKWAWVTSAYGGSGFYGFDHKTAPLDGINIPLLTEQISLPSTFPTAKKISGNDVWKLIYPSSDAELSNSN